MNIAPVQVFQTGIEFPVETGIFGRFPVFVKYGYIVFRITGIIEQPIYGLLVRAFPDNYETIRPHENVLEGVMSDKKMDLKSGEVVRKPVCLLYQPDKEISALLHTGFENGRIITQWHQSDSLYEYAIFDNEDWAGQLTRKIGTLERMVIADGHHRTAAYLKHREETQVDHGLYCALIPLDQVRVHSYHRRIKVVDSQFSEFRKFFKRHYSIQKTSLEKVESLKNNAGSGFDFLFLYHKGLWRILVPLSDQSTRRSGSADLLLQFEENVLNPFCKTYNLKVDELVDYVSETEMNLKDLDTESSDMVLIFPPVSREFLWLSSLRGEIMPAKSTWIEPRMPSDIIQVPSQI